MQIPLSATLTSQHKAHPAGAFSRETEYSSALSGISSIRGDFLRGKRYIKTKTTPRTNTQNANTAHTGKGKQRRLQAKGGQRGTSEFRRTGFGSYA